MTEQAMSRSTSPLARPGTRRLSTLCTELLAGSPRLAEKEAGPRSVDAVYAHLLAGEPKRAVRAIATQPVRPRLAAALRAWAWQLDQNTYPGGLGAELTPPSERPAPSAADDPEARLVELLVRDGPPSLSDPRGLIDNFRGLGRQADAGEIAIRVVTALGQASAEARELGDNGLAWWAALAAADLRRRSGRPDDALDRLAALRDSMIDAGPIALSWLIEGDWRATPDGSPESLGFRLWNPATPSGPAPSAPRASVPATGDLAGAAECYAQAARLAPADSPRLTGALELRLAALAFWGDRPAEYRRHLGRAGERYEWAGDRSGTTLIAAHGVIADLWEGRLADHSQDLGSGWAPPAHGPIAQIRSWARADGSQSWAVGLGRLLQCVGAAWHAQGEQSRCRVALRAALPLLAGNPRLPTRRVRTAVARIDLRQGQVARALVSLERELRGADPDRATPTDPARPADDVPGSALDPNAVGDTIEAITVATHAQLSRVRTAAAGPAADGLERRKEELTTLLARPGMPQVVEVPSPSAGGWRRRLLLGLLTAVADHTNPQQRILQAMVAPIGPLLAVIDAHIALARAEQALRSGSDVATAWYDRALAVARDNPAAPAYLVPLVLAFADRFPQARAELDRVPATMEQDNEILAGLALRCGDHVRAGQAFVRAGTSTADWRSALVAAGIARGRGDESAALDLAMAGIDDFENVIGEVVRDPDRIAACDDPDVPDLFLTAALATVALAERAEFNSARILRMRSFELAERMRALSVPNPHTEPAVDQESETAWRAWRSKSAAWMRSAELVLGTHDPTRLDDRLAAEEHAEGSLLAAEADLERVRPGFFARRRRPPILPTGADIQRSLGAETLVLEYLMLGPDLLIWAVTNDRIRAVPVAISSRKLTRLVRDHHRDCERGRGDGTDLARTLLGPVADEIRGARRLLVVPFGPLNLVPFHALPLDGRPIGLTKVVSFAPLAAPLPGRELDRPVDLRRSLVVGDPAHTATRDGFALSQLPGAWAEAEAIGRLLGTPEHRLLTGERATRAAVVEHLPDVDLLHLATHGLLNEVAPHSSSLALAGSEQLDVADLVGLSVTAKLVVLSGCDTGRGAATLGGDLVGLTRSLLQAGVEQVIVSLWPVDDNVAAVTMDLFYRGLAQRYPPAAALASAQRQVYELSDDDIAGRYESLTGRGGAAPRRRGQIDLPPEFMDDEPLPEPLDGRAERYWAPFILVGT